MSDELQISTRQLSQAGSLIRSMEGTKILRIRSKDGGRLPTDAVDALASSPTLSTIERLEIEGIELDQAALTAIVSSTSLHNLKRLAFVDCDLHSGVGENVAILVAESPNFSALHSLELALSEIGPAGMSYLGFSKTLTKLRRLRIAGGNIGDAGVCNIIDLPIWHQLDALFVADDKLTDAGVKALLDADEPKQLTQLFVGGNYLSTAAVVSLREHYGSRAVLPDAWWSTA